MKETLVPCTQGLANTGVPFGLDLPHGLQKHKKTSKFALFSLCWFLASKPHCTRIFSLGGARKCGYVLWPHTSACNPAILSWPYFLWPRNPSPVGVKMPHKLRNPGFQTVARLGSRWDTHWKRDLEWRQPPRIFLVGRTYRPAGRLFYTSVLSANCLYSNRSPDAGQFFFTFPRKSQKVV